MAAENNNPEWGFGTKAVHAGQRPDPVTGAVTVPVIKQARTNKMRSGKIEDTNTRVQVIPHAQRWN